MIAMLRRRLMSNMAKAKNIAVGTVTATVESSGLLEKRSTLTVSDLDFTPTNVVVVASDDSAIRILFTWGSMGYYASDNQLISKDASATFTANGFGFESKYSTGTEKQGFSGTYNYVAWQE